MDVGLHRTGQTTAAGALALAQALSRLPARRGRRHQLLPGPLPRRRRDDPRARRRESTRCCARRATRSPPPACRSDRISGGSTPTRYLTHETCVNELRSGTYALLDRDGRRAREVRALGRGHRHLRLPCPGQIVIDAGSKTFTSDSHPDGDHGAIVGCPAPTCTRSTRSTATSTSPALGERPAVGDRLSVVPNHACGCVNLHDGLLAVRDGVVDHVIDVSARGLVR